jgi:hypothetical protein
MRYSSGGLPDREGQRRGRLPGRPAVALKQRGWRDSDAADVIFEEDPQRAQELIADPAAFIDDALRFLEGGLAALRS